ncbi:MAG: hypothetical protein R6W73_09310 [Candidatus Saliniplasma sp.]
MSPRSSSGRNDTSDGQVYLSNYLYTAAQFKPLSDKNEISSEYRIGRDVPPIRAALEDGLGSEQLKVLKELFSRALNSNQIFLLEHIDGDNESLNSVLRELSGEHNKPLSTLKLNARILKDLGLLSYGTKSDPEPVDLTCHGEFVLKMIDFNEDDLKQRRDEKDGT